jgi:hypothetical protein
METDMNQTQILAASQADLKRRLADLDKGCFTHSRRDEAEQIRRELARRAGCCS